MAGTAAKRGRGNLRSGPTCPHNSSRALVPGTAALRSRFRSRRSGTAGTLDPSRLRTDRRTPPSTAAGPVPEGPPAAADRSRAAHRLAARARAEPCSRCGSWRVHLYVPPPSFAASTPVPFERRDARSAPALRFARSMPEDVREAARRAQPGTSAVLVRSWHLRGAVAVPRAPAGAMKSMARSALAAPLRWAKAASQARHRAPPARAGRSANRARRRTRTRPLQLRAPARTAARASASPTEPSAARRARERSLRRFAPPSRVQPRRRCRTSPTCCWRRHNSCTAGQTLRCGAGAALRARCRSPCRILRSRNFLGCSADTSCRLGFSVTIR